MTVIRNVFHLKFGKAREAVALVKLFGDKEWQANYQQMAPLVKSGCPEVFTIVE